MSAQLKNISSVAVATIASRILGLIRDVFVFAFLGVGAVNSAFVLAFTLPNLFRRLLGEGALTSALVPVLSSEVAGKDRTSAFAVLNRTLSRLAIVLLLIIGLGGALLLMVGWIPGLAPRWYLGANLSVILLPYLFFICLAAIISAQLNVLDRFFAPAITPVLLNLAMISGLLAGVWLAGEYDPARRVWWLCGGVLVGGLLQLVIPWGALRREGWQPRPDLSSTADTREITRLFLPGVAGAAIFQINILVSRLIAYALNEEAAGILYLANRLVELPLGVFAISITTVYFPLLARQAAKRDGASFCLNYERGLRLICVITLPAAVGLIVLAEPILRSLFEWGLFEAADVRRTVWPLAIFSLGLPLYAWASFATRGLHSWKEMVIPVRIGALNAVLNIALSLVLMRPLGESGLALANVIAGLAFAILLERSLRKRMREGGAGRKVSEGLPTLAAVGRMLLAALLMGAVVLFVARGMQALIPSGKTQSILTVLLGIPAGIATYAACLWLLKLPELKEIQTLLLRKRR